MSNDGSHAGPSAGRQPFTTLQEAQAAAEQIRATAGWAVLLVHGDGPGGPPKTSRRHGSVAFEGNDRVPSRGQRVRRIPPKVNAIAPDGRRVTIGSWARWDALRSRHAADTLAARDRT